VRLSDVMSSMQLSSYAEVALLLFLGAFVAIAVSLFRNRRAEEWDHWAQLPLDSSDTGSSPAAATPPSTSTSHAGHQP
jgi:cbb3-type cytochrome oxidase subunit 3